MRLSVRHQTVYEYDMPMRFVTQSHRLTPGDHGGQRVIDWRVSAEGATFGAGFRDGAGDQVTTLTVEGPIERIEISIEGLVETSDTAGVLRGWTETIWPAVYLRSTAATKPDVAIEELARSVADGTRGEGTLALSHALCDAVSEAVVYRPGVTDAGTNAGEALAAGEGVCQDHAHVLIALAHALDLPARYVTGYLYADPDEPIGEAAHAWAEIFVEGLGWVGFDSANQCCPDERYVRLGSGHDALCAAPIRGMARGGGAEALDVNVHVSAQQ